MPKGVRVTRPSEYDLAELSRRVQMRQRRDWFFLGSCALTVLIVVGSVVAAFRLW